MAKKATKAKRKIARKPRAQSLPGMTVAKHPGLSRTCVALVECREQKNELATTEKGLLGTALQQMQAVKVATYKHGGIELLLTHLDKVRVRLIADDEDATKAPDRDDDESGDIEGEADEAPEE